MWIKSKRSLKIEKLCIWKECKFFCNRQEGDAVEAEMDKPESINANKNEQQGEQLLLQQYTNVTFL